MYKTYIDLAVSSHKYMKYALALDPIVPWLKEKINKSDKKCIIVGVDNLRNEMGNYFLEDNDASFNSNLRYIMLVHGIVVNIETHKSGKKLFSMRMTTYKDKKIPRFYKKRTRLLKKLMKSDIWQKMLEEKEKSGDCIK